jgi:hypothetical protein
MSARKERGAVRGEKLKVKVWRRREVMRKKRTIMIAVAKKVRFLRLAGGEVKKSGIK